MRSAARIAVGLVLAVVCMLGVGVVSCPAEARSGPKAAQTKENIHTLQVAIQSYAVDHNDRYPRFSTNRQFRALLTPYVDRWPVNPWSHHSMRRKHNRGNFAYRRLRGSFRLIGWGPHGQRIIVVP